MIRKYMFDLSAKRVRLHNTQQSAMSIEVTKYDKGCWQLINQVVQVLLVDNSIWWQLETSDCDKAHGVNSHGYSLQRGTEWESTRRNIEGCKNIYASRHRESLRVFPLTTIPTFLCCVTRLQESLLKCYAY
ncbi:hypothetical protein TNCV_3675971 [Trichonephila clavipes]|nr:hypothetical protein TNCV_3675971 [Trichonephila clavipes]